MRHTFKDVCLQDSELLRELKVVGRTLTLRCNRNNNTSVRSRVGNHVLRLPHGAPSVVSSSGICTWFFRMSPPVSFVPFVIGSRGLVLIAVVVGNESPFTTPCDGVSLGGAAVVGCWRWS